jgi:hypothetical protein
MIAFLSAIVLNQPEKGGVSGALLYFTVAYLMSASFHRRTAEDKGVYPPKRKKTDDR